MNNNIKVKIELPNELTRAVGKELMEKYHGVTGKHLKVNSIYANHGDQLDVSLLGLELGFDPDYIEVMVTMILSILRLNPKFKKMISNISISPLIKESKIKINIDKLKDKKYFKEISDVLVKLFQASL